MGAALVLLVFFVRGIGLGLVVFPGVFRVFGVFRFFRAAVAFGRRRGRRRGTSPFLRVVVHVPARAFELHGWSRDHLFQNASAFGALLQVLIRKFANLFKAVSALLAQIFVVGHA